MASTSMTSTTAAVANPAITDKDVIEFRMANLGFSGTVSSRYTDKAKVGTTIRWGQITLLNSGTARTKSEGNNNTITKDVNLEVAVTLTINTWQYMAFELEEFEESLSIVDLAAWYTKNAAYIVDKAVDTALATLIGSDTQTQGTYLADLSDADIRRAIQYLDDANAPAEDRHLAISPAAKNGLLGVDRYASSDFIPGTGDGVNLVKGSFGNIYNMNVFTSTNVKGSNAAGHDNAIYHKDNLALGLRMKPKTHQFDDISNLSHTTAISVIYGVQIPRNDHGVWMKGA